MSVRDGAPKMRSSAPHVYWSNLKSTFYLLISCIKEINKNIMSTVGKLTIYAHRLTLEAYFLIFLNRAY